MPRRSVVSSLARGLVVAAAVCLVVGGAPPRLRAQGVLPGVSEQDLLTLLPYRLSNDELPAGFQVYEETATPNAALAFGAATGDREATLAALQAARRITGLQQTFVPPARSDGSVARLLLSLYSDAAGAAAAVNQTEPAGAGAVEALDASALGDGARLLHQLATSSSPELFAAAWSSGPLQFVVTVQGPDASAELAASFALAAQQYAAAAGDPADDATPIAPRDDATVLALGEALEQGQLPATAVPSAFSPGGAYLWSNEQLVLDARQPPAIAHLIVAEWGRVAASAQYFTSGDSTRTLLTTAIVGFVDAVGAQRAVEDESLTAATRQAVLPLAPPVQLGDETIAYRATVRWPRAELRESYTIQWRHGAAALSVTVNAPAGSGQPAYLAGVAAALDAAYLAAGQPGSGSVQ
ncbi:MAG TPA: hypothetical protein VH916_04750 [Dehalococcoidia bacterium]